MIRNLNTDCKLYKMCAEKDRKGCPVVCSKRRDHIQDTNKPANRRNNMKYLRVKMEDGSEYDIPVNVIAENRAEYYSDEFDNDLQRSLKEDTMPLFESDNYKIEDWAANNMNWSDVESIAVKISNESVDFQEGWINGDKKIVIK